MQPILPSGVKMKDFFYFFFLLLTVTILLLVNPSFINNFVESLRNLKDWLWARLSRLLEDSGLKRQAEEDEDSGDENEDGVELNERNPRSDRRVGGEV
jgi:hypothetical protein